MNGDCAGIGTPYHGHQAQERGLARAVGTDESEAPPVWDLEVHVAQCPERFGGRQSTETMRERLVQRARTMRMVQTVPLRDPPHFDRCHLRSRPRSDHSRVETPGIQLLTAAHSPLKSAVAEQRAAFDSRAGHPGTTR